MLAKYLSPVDGVSGVTSGFLLLVKNNGPTGIREKNLHKTDSMQLRGRLSGMQAKIHGSKRELYEWITTSILFYVLPQ